MTQTQSQPTQQQEKVVQMSEDEEFVFKGFERLQEIYNSAYVHF